ncbi:hypothetical protein BZA05DRAFT_434453 [Tricharina praecox]|uniref:uncharacterized protein n=1 Tax=Tricharina praecox TaxID=43433 RepID=UPI00221FEE51|nr:uncharacterized protein BZA05DRAFT_434453 [Tricharina praecox]KAI5856019.1 hypothetical protein BZA05DRAFT_434453 [Tricharina praecox]
MHSPLMTISSLLLLLLAVSASAQNTQNTQNTEAVVVTSTLEPSNTAIITLTSTLSLAPTASPTSPTTVTTITPVTPIISNLIPTNTAPAAKSQPLPTTVIVVAAVGGTGVLAAACMGAYFCCCKRRRKAVKERKGMPLDSGFFVPTPAMGERRVEEGRGMPSMNPQKMADEQEDGRMRGMPFAAAPEPALETGLGLAHAGTASFSAPFSAGRVVTQQVEYTPPRLQEYPPPPPLQPPVVHTGGYRGVQAPVRGYRS